MLTVNKNCFSLFFRLDTRQIGFYGIFSISATLYVIALFYGYFYVEEPRFKIDEKQRLKSADKSLLADFFDKEHVMETFRVAFKKGENQRRLRVSMLLIVVMVVIGPMHGNYFEVVIDNVHKPSATFRRNVCDIFVHSVQV